ncbi:MAG: enoyl-CoA hydratase/isomerase family protein [Leptolyngbya sp. PLA1]|nr:enoyl-CoA hydratase/isomerase family protein [Leptolyngbya sp. PLA1]
MISFEPVGEVAVLRFDRAAKKNALTPAMLRDLVVRIAGCNSARAVVLSGAGDVFCAGFDLTLAKDDDGALAALITELAAAIGALRDVPVPVVASAHGAAIAGGCALLCACDFVVADQASRIGYPALRLGISPAVSAPSLASVIGCGPARRLQLDPGVISGAEAARIGLVSDLMNTPAECEPRAIDLATALGRKPAAAMAHTKRWLNRINPLMESGACEAALRASLEGVGGTEQRRLLAEAWSRT